MPPFIHTSYSLWSIFIQRFLILSSVARLDLSVKAGALKMMFLEWTLREHLLQSLYFTDNITTMMLYVSGESTHCEGRYRSSNEPLIPGGVQAQFGSSLPGIF